MTNKNIIQFWGILCSESDFQKAFSCAKRIWICSPDQKIYNVSEKIQQLIVNILQFTQEKKVEIHSFSDYQALLSFSQNEDIISQISKISPEDFAIMKEIISQLKIYHFKYLEELNSGNLDIIIHKNHTNCDFWSYLEKTKWEIQNSFLVSILKTLDYLHQRFHNNLLEKYQQMKYAHDADLVLHIERNVTDLLKVIEIYEGIFEFIDFFNLHLFHKEIIESSHLVEFRWDIQNGWPVSFVSANVEKILGYSVDDFLKKNIKYEDIIFQEDLGKVKAECDMFFKEQRWFYEQNYRVKRKNGSIIHVNDKTKAKYDKNWNLIELTWFIYDTTQIIELSDELSMRLIQLELAYYTDKKTWLPNLENLKEKIVNNKERNLFLIKIKKFSKINSFFWYEVWDHILQKIVDYISKISSSVQGELYRTWQMEFAILTDNQQELKETIISSDFRFNVSYENILHIPIEISVWYAKWKWFIYDKALEALYESKKTGELVEYSEDLDNKLKEKISSNLFWNTELKNAILRWWVKVFYQGIHDNTTGVIYKYEALVRVEKDGKIFTPNLFLDVALESWMITSITKIVLEQVVEKISHTGVSISVNISEQDLLSKDFYEYLTKLISQYHIDPQKLTIEVLETITKIDDFFHVIKKIKSLGIKISIDDFWTGYSNFSRLIQLKTDFLKIDGSLIQWISQSKEKANTVRAIVDIAHINGSKVVAEFVDNHEDQKVLELLQVDYSQGYLFSKPSAEI